jgi:hypothetical protein
MLAPPSLSRRSAMVAEDSQANLSQVRYTSGVSRASLIRAVLAWQIVFDLSLCAGCGGQTGYLGASSGGATSGQSNRSGSTERDSSVDAQTLPAPGASCTVNGDCPAPMSCMLGACRFQCMADADCGGGESCADNLCVAEVASVDGGGEGGTAISNNPLPPSPPPGRAGFAITINGVVVQTPRTCPNADWEFPFPSGCVPPNPCPGVTSVLLSNTGSVLVYYTASDNWPHAGSYVPGVATGDPNQMAGGLEPGTGQYLDSFFGAGMIVLLGSSEPFSPPDNASDEGVIPWPANLAGSNGSSQMWLAEVEFTTECQMVTKLW